METQSDTEEVNLTIKNGLFYSVKRELIIAKDFIKIEESGLATEHTRFKKADITDYRYGINWISGYQFTIGREYQIFIRDKENKILKINFMSLYGIKKREFYKLYVDIMEAIWKFYFGEITNVLLDKFRDGQSIEIEKVLISNEGVAIMASGIFKEQQKIIPWEKVGTSDYQTYFNIHSKEDKANINRGYSYLNEWNTGVLYSVVRTILQEKDLVRI